MANGNGTGQGSVPANEPKVALRRSIVALLGFLVPSGGLVYLFSRLDQDRFRNSADVVYIWLEQLPTEPVFHYVVAAFAGAYLWWRWYLSAYLREEIRIREANEDNSNLTPRDWWVVQGLRRRAHTLRTLAGAILGGVVVLLFGGIYLTLFVIPKVLESDRLQAQEIQRIYAKRQFDSRLQLIGEGRYWFKVADLDQRNILSWLRIMPWAVPYGMVPVLNTYKIPEKNTLIIAIGHVKVLMTLNGGGTWSIPKGLEFEEEERIYRAVFDADGQSGVIISYKGSVFVTHNGGQSWSVPKSLEFEEDEGIMAMFDTDGQSGAIVGDKGSVFVTQDGGRTWIVPKGLEFEKGERIYRAVFDADVQSGVIIGDKGSVFVTQDGGQIWIVPKGLEFEKGERIYRMVFDADVQSGVIVSYKGSVFVTRDGGQTWIVPKDLELREDERINTAAFDADGRFGVIVGDKDSVFVTQDRGQTWIVPKDLEFEEDERVYRVVFDADVQSGVIVSNKGSISVTRDGGQTWVVSKGLELKEGEGINTMAFDADARLGVIVGSKGSALATQDGGQRWSVSKGLVLKESERIVASAFSVDGNHGVVAGDEGSVFVTRSNGRNWISTEWDSQGHAIIDVVRAIPGGRDFVAIDSGGEIHLLKTYPDMAEWGNRSLAGLRSRIQGDRILSKSVIGREITAFVDEALSADGSAASGEATRSDDDKSLFLDEVTVMRVTTLVVLFFLVHVLVRLHQYSLRLAAFWDARADAVLLARSFAYHNAETFDDLVAALAPDAYDFKPSPKSGHEGMMNLMGQLLRRESRKS